MEPPDPIAAFEYEMEKRGLTRQDLEAVIGPNGRVSEVLNRQRPLPVTMIGVCILRSKLGPVFSSNAPWGLRETLDDFATTN